MGADASDLSFCYLAREMGQAPEASREQFPKIPDPPRRIRTSTPKQSEASAPIRSIRAKAFVVERRLNSQRCGSISPEGCISERPF